MAQPGTLGKYQIRRELGRGAMGVVYEGFDPLIERTVAIKTIKADLAGQPQTEELLARFKREAQAAGRLNHPGIVQIYEYGVDGDVAFIAMEFIKGKELKDYFESGERFAIRDVSRIMGEILGALDHAHRAGVTHRDIKPANVIVLEGGAVKVADFGIARIETSELTQAGTVLGTPSYMSPEQFLGLPVDGRSDLFSCGVILYQFLTGERPFSGAVATIMHKVLKEEPLPPSTLNGTLPAAWDAVVTKSMAKSPEERYQGAAEFARDIRDVAEGRSPSLAAGGGDATVVNLGADATVVERTQVQAPGAPARGPAAARASQPVAAPQPAAAPASAAAQAPSRAPMFAVAAVAAVAVLGAGAYFALGRKTESEAKPAAAAAQPAQAPAQVASSAPPAAPAPAPAEPGVMTISAVGLADPAKFGGDAAAAGAEARNDAKRQLVEKALALYVAPDSINKNYAWVQDKFLPHAPDFIKATLTEEAPQLGKDGLVAIATRATVKVRDVQKSFNRMSDQERIQFIRNNGDPKIAVQMAIGYAETAQGIPPARSQLAENAIKERIKSFGFRTWSVEGEARTAPEAKGADFQIVGEVKVKQLSTRLAASGLTVTKTALTSWTIKAIDKASGEEIYANTKLPKATSWATEDAALADIGRQVGDEFSKDFFLAHFNFGAQPVDLKVSGLPGAEAGKALLRELRSLRGVLDAQAAGEGAYRLALPEGSASDQIAEGVVKPLNAKMGQACFALGASSGTTVELSYSAACAAENVRSRFEAAPPAGVYGAPPARGKRFIKA